MSDKINLSIESNKLIIKYYLQHFKKNFSLAFPVIFTQLGVISIGLFDNIMVGSLGKKSLASISLSNSIFFILIIFGLGISNAISSLISSLDPQKEYHKGMMIFFHGLILNFIFSLLMYGIIQIFFYIFPYLGQPIEILIDTISFLKITAISLIPWMIFEVFRKFSEGLSIIYPSLIVTWISSITNIFFNYIFINGYLGFSKLGLIGIAYSTLISRIIMLLGIILLLHKCKKIHKYYKYCKHFFFKKKYIQDILRIGIPSGLHMLFEMSAFSISSFISGKYGVKVLAAHQIIISLVSSTFLLNAAFSVTSTIRFGNQMALKRYCELKKIGKSIFIMGLIFMSICSFLFLFFIDYIPFIYINNDKEVISLTKNMIIVASIFQIPDGFQSIILGALRGMQDVKIPMYISFFSYWIVALPVSWYLSIKIKGLGVWIGLGFGIIISAILLYIRYNLLINHLIKNKK
ncbi:MATE family efflux transporter [Blattabacterium cuenoti]|uniref:MATE family efflux transporter n=1 Tax=Blattabacterium cuenoti TaxID=1653831 RepID=UPI00293C0DB9|nr:MATE family efflux transporter [Blattabacterium cuenoti]